VGGLLAPPVISSFILAFRMKTRSRKEDGGKEEQKVKEP
jgi:hypothetical protein